MVQYLSEAKVRGQIRADVDEATTESIILAFMTGVQTQHFLDPGEVDVAAALRMLHEDAARRPRRLSHPCPRPPIDTNGPQEWMERIAPRTPISRNVEEDADLEDAEAEH
jgi:hypothetical protein